MPPRAPTTERTNEPPNRVDHNLSLLSIPTLICCSAAFYSAVLGKVELSLSLLSPFIYAYVGLSLSSTCQDNGTTQTNTQTYFTY